MKTFENYAAPSQQTTRPKSATQADGPQTVAKYQDVDKSVPQYRIESDNDLKGNPEQVAEIEFIVEPPVPEGRAGGRMLASIMRRITRDFGILEAGARNSEGEPFRIEIQGKSFQIEPESKVVDIAAIPQVTGGIRLDRLQTMLDEVSELYGAQLSAIRGHSEAAKTSSGTDALKDLQTLYQFVRILTRDLRVSSGGCS